MTSIKTLGLCLALTLPAGAARAQNPAPTPETAALALSFPDLKTKTGPIMIVVFDSAQGWASGKPAHVAMASAADAEPAARIEGLKPGLYAARVFQDVNSDGKLGANPFGLPTEPYGFSNAAQANMGPPSFEEASFTLIAGDNAQIITLK